LGLFGQDHRPYSTDRSLSLNRVTRRIFTREASCSLLKWPSRGCCPGTMSLPPFMAKDALRASAGCGETPSCICRSNHLLWPLQRANPQRIFVIEDRPLMQMEIRVLACCASSRWPQREPPSSHVLQLFQGSRPRHHCRRTARLLLPSRALTLHIGGGGPA